MDKFDSDVYKNFNIVVRNNYHYFVTKTTPCNMFIVQHDNWFIGEIFKSKTHYIISSGILIKIMKMCYLEQILVGGSAYWKLLVLTQILIL